jgi:integrase
MRERGWRNRKHRRQWSATLTTYAYPLIGAKPVSEVSTDDVLAILSPIWAAKSETASRVRGRIEAVLDAAKVRGWRQGENPARWRGHLALLLPAKAKVRNVRHHPALDWKRIRQFMRHATEQPGRVWLAARFAVLTATRSGEVRGARWSEIDLDGATWTIPGSRMKAHRQHRVPLSAPALDGLRKARGGADPATDELVFSSSYGGRLSDMSLTMALRRLGWTDAQGNTITLHGFRSTFRDWCGEATSHSDSVAEAALAHTIGNKVQAAYQRGDLLEKRKRLMDDWAAFCCPAEADDDRVVVLRATAS